MSNQTKNRGGGMPTANVSRDPVADVDPKDLQRSAAQQTEGGGSPPEDASMFPPPPLSEEAQAQAEMDLALAKKAGMKSAEAKKQAGLSGPMQVVATGPGFIYNERKKAGDKFQIRSEKEFSSVWMEKI